MIQFLGQGNTRIYHELQPMFSLNEIWQVGLVGLVAILIVVFVVWMYRRDSVELPTGITALLMSLRLLALLAILLFVLNPGRRTETRLVKTSKLAVLIDTSLSMGLRDKTDLPGSIDTDPGLNSAGPAGERPRRIDEVLAAIEGDSAFEKLRENHDVTFYRFGEQAQPAIVGTLPKLGAVEEAVPLTASEKLKRALSASRTIGIAALLVATVALFLFVGWCVSRFSKPDIAASGGGVQAAENLTAMRRSRSWILAVSIWTMILAVTLMAWSDLTTPRFDLWTSMGWKSLPEKISALDSSAGLPDSMNESDAESADGLVQDIDWGTELSPRGTSTKLGTAVRYIVNKERGGPIAGIVLISDGRNNGGVQPTRAMAAASNAGIPVFPIGIGSSSSPKNVQVADIQAPPRVFPGDKFEIKGLVSATGLEGQTVTVSLVSIDERETEAELVEAEMPLRLGADNQQLNVSFDVQRQAQGKRRYTIRVSEIESDLDAQDNHRTATVEIVDRKTRVLLIAGGPTREFRFLRNQLYRDDDVVLHVWLQTAKVGADQESDELLFDFPQTRESIFQYDCVLAFDPDWRKLSEEQADMLERWVAEKAGGMLVVAGPVNTPEWTRRPRGDKTMDTIRKLYPVAFYNQGSSVLKLGRFGGEQAFPLDFSREGRAAEYLWLGDTSADSVGTWGQFKGVFGYLSLIHI